jgi:hypothetical protein
MPGINALLLGYLMYRPGLVPRLIPVLGLIGAPLLLASAIACPHGPAHGYGVTRLATGPEPFNDLQSRGLRVLLTAGVPCGMPPG